MLACRRDASSSMPSAWLIRRFIDPDAGFVWLSSAADCPKKALGFDFDGAWFTHVGMREAITDDDQLLLVAAGVFEGLLTVFNKAQGSI